MVEGGLVPSPLIEDYIIQYLQRACVAHNVSGPQQIILLTGERVGGGGGVRLVA